MQDTFMEAVRLVVSTIKEHPTSVGLMDREHVLLERISQGDIGWLNLVSYRLDGTSIDLLLRVDGASRCGGGMAVDLVTDPETGDVYKLMTFDFKVNYCAHGSESPDVVLARATAIMGVASLAQRLGELVNSHYFWFLKSKAEMDEIKAQKQASEERRELARFVTTHSVRQVIGKTRRIESVHGFSTAVHTVTLPNDRRFKVDCRGAHVVYLTRLD